MNVAFDPWIPVVDLTGTRRLVSLSSVFAEGHSYADLTVRPHERVALMRLFLCVAHSALGGPKNDDDWKGAPQRLSEAAIDYLTKWKDSFELFHPRKPWLQIPTLSKERDRESTDSDSQYWTPVAKFDLSLSSGHNSTLLDHEGENANRHIPLPDTVLSLVAFQCFSSGGLISQVFWNGAQTTKSSHDAPCLSSSMVHTLLRGPTLVESIHLNLPTYEGLRPYYASDGIGRAVWEQMPASFEDHEAVANASRTYLGRLVPLARLVRLHPTGQQALLGDGLTYPSFANGFAPEPTATVVIRKNAKTQVRSLLSFRPAKALWRELGAVLIKRKAGQPGGPIALNVLAEGEPCDLVVAALSRDQATITDAVESVFFVRSNLATQLGAQAYDTEVKWAETLEQRISRAVETYRREIDGGWDARIERAGSDRREVKSKLCSTATSHYWTIVEENLGLLIDHIDVIGTNEATSKHHSWRKMLFETAAESYEIACGRETPRQIRAFSMGWRVLISANGASQKDDSNDREDEA